MKRVDIGKVHMIVRYSVQMDNRPSINGTFFFLSCSVIKVDIQVCLNEISN